MMKLEIKIPKNYTPYRGSIVWKSCFPFVDNKLAMLIHRPMEVTTYVHYKKPYIGVKALCGNTFVGNDKFTFIEIIPENSKLLCTRCEAKAIELGLPSADELNGRHIHLGKLIPIKTCCNENNRD